MLAMSEEGLVVTDAHVQSIFRWSAFRCVLEHKQSVYLMIDNGAGVIVPRTAFESKADRLRFMADATNLLERATAGA